MAAIVGRGEVATLVLDWLRKQGVDTTGICGVNIEIRPDSAVRVTVERFMQHDEIDGFEELLEDLGGHVALVRQRYVAVRKKQEASPEYA